jgi:hypothetical protein
LARGWNGRLRAFHSIEDHASLLAVVAYGVFPLTFLGLDSEPLLGDLGCGRIERGYLSVEELAAPEVSSRTFYSLDELARQVRAQIILKRLRIGVR